MRFKLDPLAPNGVSQETNQVTRVVQSTSHAMKGDDGRVQNIIAGTNVTVDSSDPANPIINVASGDGSGDMLAATYDPQNIAADVFDRANHTGTQSADTLTDGVTNHVFTAVDDTKLAGIESLADVTDTTNVTAAGALMDSEVTSLSGIKTLTVPDSTTISTAGAALIDDANAAAQLVTLGLTATAAELNALDGITSTVTELNYTDGVTSNIQTQIDGKQALDADLTSWAAITRAAGFDTFVATPSGANLASLMTTALPASKGGTGLTALAANIVSLLGAADYAAVRTLLSLVIGTNVQAWDADLDTYATKSPPSGAVVGTTDTQTLTNKRITKRVGTTTSSATPTINTDDVDVYTLTAQTADITSFTTNLSGTPTNWQMLAISVTGTAARAITWGASFEASTVALPTTTVSTDTLDVLFRWNSATSKWRCLAVS